MPKIVARKEDWIQLGYKLFSEGGVNGLIVEKMSRKLKVNKSSFYWHFKSKQDFIDEIIAYWVNLDTQKIIEKVERNTSGKEKFSQLIKIVFHQDPYQDFFFFLKRYARKHKKTQALIDKIDNERITYTQTIIKAMGFSAHDALIKATLFYKYLIGYHEMIRYKKQSKDYVDEVIRELNQFINTLDT